MKKNTIGAATLVSLSLIVSAFSVAQAETIAPPTTCYSFTSSFGRGASDARYAGAVTELQSFLISQGYFDSRYAGTGYFGPKTYTAVIAYQRASGISATGYVGPLTRASIQAKCGHTQTEPVTLINVSPRSGAIGSSITVTGKGFTSNNTVLMDGMVVARNVPITSSIGVSCSPFLDCIPGIRQTLTFSIPDSLSPYCPLGAACAQYMRLLNPGTYSVTVMNDNGTSNAIKLIVTGTNAESLTITGIDAPTSITYGVPATWTIRTNTRTTAGVLHYSVIWGDEVGYQSSTAFRAPDSEPLSTSASFTHTYRTTGTYTPVFTVTDDYGHSASASASILVTPIY